MILSKPGQTRILDPQYLIDEINELLHHNLDQEWAASEWNRIEHGGDNEDAHPMIRVAFTAHKQISSMVKAGVPGITPEIWELAELAMKINALKRSNIPGIDSRLSNLTSHDFYLYRTARYEIQVAGMLLQRGHNIEFVEECARKTPDILLQNTDYECEIECKHKEPSEDQIDYIKSIYNNTQTARKQFSKRCPAAIFIEIAKPRFDEYQIERKRLVEEMKRAMRNSSSISAIFLSSVVEIAQHDDLVYRHRVSGMLSDNPRYHLPKPLLENLVNT